MSEDNRSTAASRPARRTSAAGRSTRNRNAENLRRSAGTAQASGRRTARQGSPDRISGRSSRNSRGNRKRRPEIPPVSLERNSNIIDGITFGFSIALLLGAAVGSVYSGAGDTLIEDFIRILTMPAPLVTDYFALGSLPAAFLNAGLCGLSMALFMFFMPGGTVPCQHPCRFLSGDLTLFLRAQFPQYVAVFSGPLPVSETQKPQLQ